jgi:glycosyltransferase involved in cell wall biosynthesis
MASFLRGSARRSAFAVDSWSKSHAKIGCLATMQKLDPCFVAFRQSQKALAKDYPRARFEWLPFGIDTNVFFPRGIQKDIFIYWMGRRYEPLHQAILAYCAAHNLKYVYTVNSGEIPNPGDLGKLVSRARYFVVTPPDLDNPARTGGISPLVMRYMEGLAAGTRLLGVLPGSGEYEDLLPLDAILQVAPDGSDLARKLEMDAENPDADRAVARASELVRTHHSWERRAEQIYVRLKDGKAAF